MQPRARRPDKLAASPDWTTNASLNVYGAWPILGPNHCCVVELGTISRDGSSPEKAGLFSILSRVIWPTCCSKVPWKRMKNVMPAKTPNTKSVTASSGSTHKVLQENMAALGHANPLRASFAAKVRAGRMQAKVQRYFF